MIKKLAGYLKLIKRSHRQIDEIHGRMAELQLPNEKLNQKIVEEFSKKLDLQTVAIADEIRLSNVKESLLQAGRVSASLIADSYADTQKAGNYIPAKKQSFGKLLGDMKKVNPKLFPVWHQLFENFKKDSIGNVDGFFSHWDQEYARLFSAYINLHARGRILDIGCGNQGLPVYLSNFPTEMISGIDPLPADAAAEFEQVQGFNEFLPWPDGAFNTAVNATSLDHVLSLDLALRETARVLAPGGRFIVWIASVPGSPAFDTDQDAFKAIDRYHLFHFERQWIEPLIKKYFRFVDITIIPQPGFDHVFYSLTPLKANR